MPPARHPRKDGASRRGYETGWAGDVALLEEALRGQRHEVFVLTALKRAEGEHEARPCEASPGSISTLYTSRRTLQRLAARDYLGQLASRPSGNVPRL